MKGVVSFWKHKTVAILYCNNSQARALTRDKEYSAWMKRGLSKKCTYGTGRIVQVRTINFDGFFLVMFSLLLRVLSCYQMPQLRLGFFTESYWEENA